MGGEVAEQGDHQGKAVVSLPPNLNDAEIRKRLGGYSGYDVLRFTSMVDAITVFSKPAEETKFRGVVSSVMGIWCCVRAPTGHIWYDMLWDVVPHVDKHGRKWENEWEMKLGP